MKIETKTVVTLELDSIEAGAIMIILNGFRSLEINEKDFFSDYSIGSDEHNKIDDLSKKLNSISTFLES